MWKKLEGINNSKGACRWDIYLVASIVVKGWTNIPPIKTVWSPTCALGRLFMQDDPRSWRGQGCSIEVEIAFDMLVRA